MSMWVKPKFECLRAMCSRHHSIDAGSRSSPSYEPSSDRYSVSGIAVFPTPQPMSATDVEHALAGLEPAHLLERPEVPVALVHRATRPADEVLGRFSGGMH